ncbi:MAG TPA: hypothetical protein VLG13_01810 [Patescibacteria group bacterium]|nr:hypothetical protein [Patescibacteria group bacterium]
MDSQPPSPPADATNELESLEGPATAVEQPSTPVIDTPTNSPGQPPSAAAPPPDSKPPRLEKLRNRARGLNIYLLVFILLLVVSGIISYVAYNASKRNNGATVINSQTLDQKTLQQLANADATIGTSNQVLNVQSNTVFGGKVLVRDSLEVAGGLQLGGSLSLGGITVSGSSTFGQVQVNNNLAVAGDTALQGQLTVQKNLNVNGSGTFGGALSASQLTVSALQLNGDLTLTHHITAGGATPSRTSGPALGSGGTASLSGSDTSGSININTGGSPGAGCFITVNFAAKFNATPHVIVSPVGSGAAGLSYYINRSTSNFSICTTSAPPSNAGFGFDYLVLD